jgi:hypothetical protein
MEQWGQVRALIDDDKQLSDKLDQLMSHENFLEHEGYEEIRTDVFNYLVETHPGKVAAFMYCKIQDFKREDFYQTYVFPYIKSLHFNKMKEMGISFHLFLKETKHAFGEHTIVSTRKGHQRITCCNFPSLAVMRTANSSS